MRYLTRPRQAISRKHGIAAPWLIVACMTLGAVPTAWAAPDVTQADRFLGPDTSVLLVTSVFFPDNAETLVPGRYTYVYQLIAEPLNNALVEFQLLDISPSTIELTGVVGNQIGVPATAVGAGDWTFVFPFTGDTTQPLYVIATAGPVSGRALVKGTLESVTADTLVPGHACPLGLGFWANHPGAWPVASLTLGGQMYTKAQLLTILKAPVRGDASLNLARQLIAAKINIAQGSSVAPVSAIVTAADSLLAQFAGMLPYDIAPSSAIAQQMIHDADVLSRYNSGDFTPSSCAGG